MISEKTDWLQTLGNPRDMSLARRDENRGTCGISKDKPPIVGNALHHA